MTSLNELEKIEASQLVIEQSDVLFEINEIYFFSGIRKQLKVFLHTLNYICRHITISDNNLLQTRALR